jgi:hypothetical protein
LFEIKERARNKGIFWYLKQDFFIAVSVADLNAKFKRKRSGGGLENKIPIQLFPQSFGFELGTVFCCIRIRIHTKIFMTTFFLNLPDKIFFLSNPFSTLFKHEISSIVSFLWDNFDLPGSGSLAQLNPDQILIRNTGSPYLESLLPRSFCHGKQRRTAHFLLRPAAFLVKAEHNNKIKLISIKAFVEECIHSLQ